MRNLKVGFFSLLWMLGVLASATHAAETAAPVKHYLFELHTLNLGEQVRKGQVKFNVDNGMTEDELDAVNHVLDELGASPVDDHGYRELSMSNGSRVRIGGFLTEGFLEDSVEGVHVLPVEFSVEDAFSATEAAVVLRIARAGNLYFGSSDPDRVASPAEVKDRRFHRSHKQVSITPDENSLADWIRQNVPSR
jgi:hypothetical protein